MGIAMEVRFRVSMDQLESAVDPGAYLRALILSKRADLGMRGAGRISTIIRRVSDLDLEVHMTDRPDLVAEEKMAREQAKSSTKSTWYPKSPWGRW